MHYEAYAFVTRAVAGLPEPPARVLELGSFDVNGSVRPLFPQAARYHGIDVRPGPGVDEVADAATYRSPRRYDCVVTTEMLEHAPDPRACLETAWHQLRTGGWLILTAAGPERAPHSCNGGPVVPPEEHYANLTPAVLSDWLAAWADVQVTHNPQAGDVYAVARKP